MKRFIRLFAALLIFGFLAACGSVAAPGTDVPGADGIADDDVSDAGYVSGDGTVTIWKATERNEPVELEGETFAEDPVDLADWRGDIAVLNFWYAACPPCRAEAPDLKEVAEETADDGVRFLGVNSTDDPGTAAAFERTFEVPYPSLHDARSLGVAALQGKVALQAVPTTVILDPDGRVAARVIGRADAATLRSLIKDIQAEFA